jgi:hypothetical protein
MAQEPGFIGSWHLTRTDAADKPEPALVTFAADGVMLTSPGPVVPQAAAPDGVLCLSAGHGAWGSTGANTAVITFMVLATDGRARPFGLATIRGIVTLDGDGHAFSGEGVRTIVNPAGVVVETMPIRVRATRIVAEAPATPAGVPAGAARGV